MDRLALAMHESGHLVAASVLDVGWDVATIVPDGPYHGYVAFTDDPHPFIFWCGPAAQARATGQPLDAIINSESSSQDRAEFAHIRSPDLDREWSAALDSVWPMVEACAARLLLSGTLRPDQPDPLQDRTAIAAFLATLDPQ